MDPEKSDSFTSYPPWGKFHAKVYTAPAYLLPWRSTLPRPSFSLQRPIVFNTPESLEFIFGGRIQGKKRRSNAGSGSSDDGDDLFEEDDDALDPIMQRSVFVFHGTPKEYVDVVTCATDIDPLFVDCVRAGTRYSGLSLLARGRSGTFSRVQVRRWWAWEYPELIEGDVEENGSDGPRVVKIPRTQEGNSSKDNSVVFRRVAVWVSGADVFLFLDKPLSKITETEQESDDSGRNESVMSETLSPTSSIDASRSRATQSIEDAIINTILFDDRQGSIKDILSEAVNEKWLELFDVLEPPLASSLRRRSSFDSDMDMVSLYWQMLQSLEFNENGVGSSEWTSTLTSRVQRRIDLLTLRVNSIASSRSVSTIWSRPPSMTPVEAKAISRRSTANFSEKRVGQTRRRTLDQDEPIDENQRALDRIGYIGGILIPIPIVGGILSMGEVFGPYGPKFWVFWAVAIPLAIVTVFIIYADTIRTMEVWVEIPPERVIPTATHNGLVGGSDTKGGVQHIGIGDVDVEVKEHRTVTWRRRHDTHGGEDEHAGPRHQNVVFALDHDTEERHIGTPLATAAAAATVAGAGGDEAVTGAVLEGLPQSVRWKTGLVAQPAVILERVPSSGLKQKAWKRQELGWYGVVKSVFYIQPRAVHDVPEGVPACELPGKRRTKT
ncbi:hypothetical protein QBC35DRAFT_491608 [Podospora australis]|uniref:Uncharacterized protein n=1 Tax=Podospora australis TaxID=1536484 RepID=A0AAN6WXA8_9PEZI|nr:hypothetical protein QBC35DRAFT_491608 [Podospora australis]